MSPKTIGSMRIAVHAESNIDYHPSASYNEYTSEKSCSFLFDRLYTRKPGIWDIHVMSSILILFVVLLISWSLLLIFIYYVSAFTTTSLTSPLIYITSWQQHYCVEIIVIPCHIWCLKIIHLTLNMLEGLLCFALSDTCSRYIAISEIKHIVVRVEIRRVNKWN